MPASRCRYLSLPVGLSGTAQYARTMRYGLSGRVRVRKRARCRVDSSLRSHRQQKTRSRPKPGPAEPHSMSQPSHMGNLPHRTICALYCTYQHATLKHHSSTVTYIHVPCEDCQIQGKHAQTVKLHCLLTCLHWSHSGRYTY